MMAIKVPSVRNHGDSNVEPFEIYFQRWPKALSNFPPCVIKNWVHRHWREFSAWLKFDLETFEFKSAQFSNPEIMAIGHFDDWFRTLDYWGDDLFKDELRRSTWLASFMLKYGTSPAPIIVAINADQVKHPLGGFLKTPSHLIEGHMRLAYLRGMIRHNHPTLKDSHAVWQLYLPVSKSASN